MVVQPEDDVTEPTAAKYARMAIGNPQNARRGSNGVWRDRDELTIGGVVTLRGFPERNRFFPQGELDGAVLMVACGQTCHFGDSGTQHIRASTNDDQQRRGNCEPASAPDLSRCRL